MGASSEKRRGEGERYLFSHNTEEDLIIVPECVHGNPGGEVNIAAVLKIPQMTAVGLCKDGGGPAVCCDHVLLMVRNQARRPRVRGGVVGRVGGLMLHNCQ